VRTLIAELGSTPQRWRRATRIGLLTALGAGLTATLQIGNALGLTLLFNMGAPEMAMSFAASVRFLLGAAICQAVGLALAGAMADSPLAHLSIFAVLSLVSGYLIYGDARVGRKWVWVQVPVLTAFYLVLFDPGGFGWNDAEAFAAVAVAVGILYVANSVLWPKPAAEVLSESLADTVDRSRRRLRLLLDIWAGADGLRPEDDRPVASKLGYHLTLLAPAARRSRGAQVPGMLVAAVMVAERIHNEIERIAELLSEFGGGTIDDVARGSMHRAGAELDAMLDDYVSGMTASRPAPQEPHAAAVRAELARLREHLGGAPDPSAAGSRLFAVLIGRLENICALLEIDPAQLPASGGPPGSDAESSQAETFDARRATSTAASATDGGVLQEYIRRPIFNRLLIRYTVRHTLAMTIAFLSGLFVNNAAMHAALWLLMIGGPPSHGATARKFTIRAAGSAIAMALTAVCTLLLAPNGTTLFSYVVAVFAGSLLMAYVGQGGGLLSYLSIGGTAFVIAFSGPGPRNDAFASIWTIWGISFGMLVRAAVAMVWRERASRTLVEQFQVPIEALIALVSAAHWRDRAAAEIDAAQMALIEGLREMLSVASDAQLEGHGAGIDAANLVDALDSLRRVGFMLANQALRDTAAGPVDSAAGLEPESLAAALHARFADWLESLRVQDADGVPSLTPLRDMVQYCYAPDLSRWLSAGGEQGRLVATTVAMEHQLTTVSVH